MDPITGMSLARIAIGAATLVAPESTARISGLDPDANPQLDYYAGMFAAREIAVGAITLVSSGSRRRNLVLAGVAIDAADAMTAGLGLNSKRIPVKAAAPLAVAALFAVGTGVASLVRSKRG